MGGQSLPLNGITCNRAADYSKIRESVDSLCRDGADMPMPPYIQKACKHPNAAFVISICRYLTVIHECFST